jgi:hypothetical protein
MEIVPIDHFAPCRNLKRLETGQAIAVMAEDKLRQGGGARLLLWGRLWERLLSRWLLNGAGL